MSDAEDGTTVTVTSKGQATIPKKLVVSQSGLEFASGSLNCEVTAHGCFG